MTAAGPERRSKKKDLRGGPKRSRGRSAKEVSHERAQQEMYCFFRVLPSPDNLFKQVLAGPRAE